MDNTLGKLLIDTAIATPLLAAITPSIAFAAVNTTFFTRRQIRNTVVFMGCLGCLLCVALLAAAWLGFSVTGINSASGVLTAALLLGMNDTLFQELLPRRRTRLLTQCGIAAAVIALCIFLPVAATLLCLVYLALSCHDLRRNIGKGGGVPIYTDEPLHTEAAPTRGKAEIPFSEHPNIYCFYLESVHSEKAIQELYHSDAGQDIRLFLEKYGYRVYPEGNATMDWTIVSRTSLIEHRIPWDYNDRGFIRSPWVLRILRENGYRIKLFDVDNTAYVLGDYADAADFCSFELPRFVLRCFRLMTPLFAQSRAFRWLVGGRDPGATEPMGEAAYFELLRQNIRHAKAGAPEFSLIRFGAPHTAYYKATWTPPENWSDAYLKGYAQAMSHLKTLVEDIHAHDPKACVVIVGDHGAHSLDHTWVHQNTPMDGIAAHAVSLEKLYLDLFSVLCAVKWPSRGEPEGFSPAHINLFVWIFLSLSGREELRQSLVPNICLLSHRWRDFYLLARDRKPLPVLQRFTGTDEMLAWQQQNDAAYEKDWRFHYVALKKLLSLAPTSHVLDSLRQQSEKLLPLLPDTNEGQRARAEVLLRVQHEPRLSIPIYKTLLAKGEGIEKDWTRLLFCHQLLGDTASALDLLEQGAGRFYAAEQLPSRTAHLYYTMGNLDAACERCLPLVEEHPGSYDYAKLLYRIVYAQGDMQHACAILEKYGAYCAECGQRLANPQDFYKNSGLSALLLSRWDDAARAFAKQRESGGRGVWLTALEAFALERTGATAQALELWQQQQYSPAWSELRALFAVRNHIGPDAWREEGENLLLRQETALVEAGLCLMPSEKLRHWLCTGVFLGEKPNELFDPFFYLSYNSEAFLNGSNPLINYTENPLCWTSPVFFAYRYLVQHHDWKHFGGTPLAAALNRQPSKGAADI